MFVFFFHKDGSNYSCCGKHDNDLQGRHSHTAGEQKFVNLFDIMLSSFCGKGHYVTCDSTYMGDIMALIATIQANRTGVQMAASVNRPQSIKKKTYEYKMWQHNTQSSVAAVWSDNNLVKILSNKLSSTADHSCWDDEKKNRGQWDTRKGCHTSQCANAKCQLF